MPGRPEDTTTVAASFPPSSALPYHFFHVSDFPLGNRFSCTDCFRRPVRVSFFFFFSLPSLLLLNTGRKFRRHLRALTSKHAVGQKRGGQECLNNDVLISPQCFVGAAAQVRGNDVFVLDLSCVGKNININKLEQAMHLGVW